MNDVGELPAQEVAGVLRYRRRMPTLAALAVAILSVVAWSGVRSNEIRQAEILQDRQVEAELVVLQDRLEQVEVAIADIGSALARDGVESREARSLAEQQATPFVQFAIASPAEADPSFLAFAADDFEPYTEAIDADLLFSGQPDSRSNVAEVPNAENVVSISKSFVEQAAGADESPVAVVAVVSLTSAPLVGDGTSNDSQRFLFEVDGIRLRTSTEQMVVAEPERFNVGQHRWEVLPVGLATEVSHLGSNVLWAAGVGLTTLMFLSLRHHQDDEEAHDELMRNFYRLTDPVTGFLNAEGVQEELKTRIKRRRRSGQVGVLLCEMDRYEGIKKSLGPKAADEVVKMTFVRVQALLTGTDSCGRFGESQVLIMSNGLPAVRDLEDLAQQIRREFSDPLELSDGTICHVSFTIGIALTRSPETTASSLLSDVLLAQRAATSRGGTDYFVFSEEQRLEEITRRDLLNELLGAVREKELTVHYQPVVRMGKKVTEMLPVEKVEALVRWPHAVRGMVHPGVFLPLSVEAGVDLKVAELVLTDACSHAIRWSETLGRPITVVVNVGERQLVDLRLVGLVRDVLRSTGLSAGQLELDIPEELMLRTSPGTQEVMQQLRDAGVRISLDDFGASSGSLQKLTATTVISTVKIDRAFVEDIETNVVNQKVISAVVSMAKECEIAVVAEGVETTTELEELYMLGVTEAQGFLFNRPGPPEVILPTLSDSAATKPRSVHQT